MLRIGYIVVLHESWFHSDEDGNFGLTDTVCEKDGIDRGHLKFFSTETNTIFPPRLEVEYDDSSFSTALLPLTVSSLEDTVIYTKNLRETYMEKSTPKIRIGLEKDFLKMYLRVHKCKIFTKWK